ncbi:hypothetical protein PIB30_112702, partial [Stylosanthes scabra]|nr:hypothetical protein [Stylosanthes scabra]
ASKLQEEEEFEELEDEEEELAFLLKRFNRLTQKKNLNFTNKAKQPPKCFGCGEVGHIKPNCPKAQKEDKEKRFKKKKAYISWENEGESESSDEDENANICLMAKDDEVCDSNSESSNELQDEYDSLFEEFTKLAQEFSSMKKKNSEFQKQIDVLKNENIALAKRKSETNNQPCTSCEEHLLEIEKLKKSLSKFNESSKNLHEHLKNQKHEHDKKGIVNHDYNMHAKFV